VLAFGESTWFSGLTVFWLWLTVLFANLAEAVAEGAVSTKPTLLASPMPTPSRTACWIGHQALPHPKKLPRRYGAGRHRGGHRAKSSPATAMWWSIASVDESAITRIRPGDSESGGDRLGVTGERPCSRNRSWSDHPKPGESFVGPHDRTRRVRDCEYAQRIAAQHLPSRTTHHLRFRGATLQRAGDLLQGHNPGVPDTDALNSMAIAASSGGPAVCLIPTTIGALLSAYRHRRHGPAGPATAGHVPARPIGGDVNTLLLTSTGTITGLVNRQGSNSLRSQA